MTGFQRGQLWLVNFEPSVGHEYRKVRPAVVVQQNEFLQEASSLVTVLPVSSKITKQSDLDVCIVPDTMNRLMKDSLIKTKQISSFDRRRFIKYIGVLRGTVMHEIDANLRRYLL